MNTQSKLDNFQTNKNVTVPFPLPRPFRNSQTQKRRGKKQNPQSVWKQGYAVRSCQRSFRMFWTQAVKSPPHSESELSGSDKNTCIALPCLFDRHMTSLPTIDMLAHGPGSGGSSNCEYENLIGQTKHKIRKTPNHSRTTSRNGEREVVNVREKREEAAEPHRTKTDRQTLAFEGRHPTRGMWSKEVNRNKEQQWQSTHVYLHGDSSKSGQSVVIVYVLNDAFPKLMLTPNPQGGCIWRLVDALTMRSVTLQGRPQRSLCHWGT